MSPKCAHDNLYPKSDATVQSVAGSDKFTVGHDDPGDYVAKWRKLAPPAPDPQAWPFVRCILGCWADDSIDHVDQQYGVDYCRSCICIINPDECQCRTDHCHASPDLRPLASPPQPPAFTC